MQYQPEGPPIPHLQRWADEGSSLDATRYPIPSHHCPLVVSCRWNGFNQQATLFEVNAVGTSMHGVVMHGDSGSVQLDKVYIAWVCTSLDYVVQWWYTTAGSYSHSSLSPRVQRSCTRPWKLFQCSYSRSSPQTSTQRCVHVLWDNYWTTVALSSDGGYFQSSTHTHTHLYSN